MSLSKQLHKSEHQEQVALFQWAEYQSKYPELKTSLFYTIPNGGKRHVGTAKKLKAEGVKSGVLDVNLDVAKGSYHGLRIEMKVGRNKLTDNQKVHKELLDKNNYMTCVCYSCEEAIQVIEGYMEVRE